MTIYLSGPMTGHKDFNSDLFAHVAGFLRRNGFDVINPYYDLPVPVGLTGEEEKDWWLYVRRCLDYLHENPVDMVLFLPGFGKSTGAMMEYHMALKMGIEAKDLFQFVDEMIQMERGQK